MGSIIGWHCEDCRTGESLFLGRWCLDDVRFSHDAPGKGYDDSLRCWVRWGEVVTLTDDRIQKITYMAEPSRTRLQSEACTTMGTISSYMERSMSLQRSSGVIHDE